MLEGLELLVVNPNTKVVCEKNTIGEMQRKKAGEFVLTKDENKCGFCPYRSLCNRGISASNFIESKSCSVDERNLFPDFDQLPEIYFDG